MSSYHASRILSLGRNGLWRIDFDPCAQLAFFEIVDIHVQVFCGAGHRLASLAHELDVQFDSFSNEFANLLHRVSGGDAPRKVWNHRAIVARVSVNSHQVTHFSHPPGPLASRWKQGSSGEASCSVSLRPSHSLICSHAVAGGGYPSGAPRTSRPFATAS